MSNSAIYVDWFGLAILSFYSKTVMSSAVFKKTLTVFVKVVNISCFVFKILLNKYLVLLHWIETKDVILL